MNLRAATARIAHAREDNARCATASGSVVRAAQGTPRIPDGPQLPDIAIDYQTLNLLQKTVVCSIAFKNTRKMCSRSTIYTHLTVHCIYLIAVNCT